MPITPRKPRFDVVLRMHGKDISYFITLNYVLQFSEWNPLYRIICRKIDSSIPKA